MSDAFLFEESPFVANSAQLSTALNYHYEVRPDIFFLLLPLPRMLTSPWVIPPSQAMAAIALDEIVPDPEDETVPSYNLIHRVYFFITVRISDSQLTALSQQNAGANLIELKALIAQDEGEVPTSDRTNNNKRSHAQASDPSVDLSGLIAELKSKGKKVKVEELKQACRALGEKVSGKKDELYERVIANLKKAGKWESDGGESEGDIKPQKKKKRVVYSKDDE